MRAIKGGILLICALLPRCKLVRIPRTARASVDNVCCHVLNRGNGRMTVFHQVGVYGAFLKLLNEANQHMSMRLLSFCLMPKHFHLVAWPRVEGALIRLRAMADDSA